MKSVLVLGPAVPDYPTLINALHKYGNRVRGIGIPFGETQAQINESVLLQIRSGVLGLRVDPRTLIAYPSVLQHLGENKRWLYAIGAVDSDAVMLTLINWLERYPDAHIAAPHFLKTRAFFTSGKDHELINSLVSHPRFHPIFSRHGGLESHKSYPHTDFSDWVEYVINTSGWDNVLWGSEYPVYTWRNETMSSCIRWLPSLLENITDDQRTAILYHNTQRIIFDQRAPTQETVTIPAWVDQQFNLDRKVPLFPDGLHIPMHTYHDLHKRYVCALKHEPNLTLSTFITHLIKSD